MCIAFWQSETGTSSDLSFVLASNRDEYLARPAEPADWRSFDPASEDKDVLCGVDVTAEGTWLGVSRSGRFALLTNFTEPTLPRTLPDGTPRPSRGNLTRDFLAGTSSIDEYAAQLRSRDLSLLAGFSLLIGRLGAKSEFAIITNRVAADSEVPLTSGKPLKAGTISNDHFSADAQAVERWPKVTSGSRRFSELLHTSSSKESLVDGLLELMSTQSDTFDAADPLGTIRTTICVPATKFTRPSQKRDISATETVAAHLSGYYGTRTQTVILIDRVGKVTFVERDAWVLDASSGEAVWSGEKRLFEFQLQK